MPVRLLLGNHDDRAAFRATFPDVATDPHGFVQSMLDGELGRFIFLDTNEPGTHAGWYCTERQAWLRERLAEVAGRPVYLFMHHHPFPVHLQAADDLILRQSAEFAEIISGHAVRHIFFGHVHRPIAGSWHGIPFTTLRGLNHQVWLDFSPGRASSSAWSHRPTRLPSSARRRSSCTITISSMTARNTGTTRTGRRERSSSRFPADRPEQKPMNDQS